MLSALISLIFISNFSNATEVLNCEYTNNKKFEIEVSKIIVNKSWESYYSMSLLAINLDTPENVYAPLSKEFSCESNTKSNLSCFFKNGRILLVKVEGLSLRNQYFQDYDDRGIVFKSLQKTLYINDRSIESLLYKYRNVECEINF